MPEKKYRPIVLIRSPSGRLIKGKPREIKAEEPIEISPPPQTREQPKITARGSFLPAKGRFVSIPDPDIAGGEILISSSGRGHRRKQLTESERVAMHKESEEIDVKMNQFLREKAEELKKKGKWIPK